MNYCKDNLLELKDLLVQLQDFHFTKKLEVLYHSSIGQHVRHVLEFYQCLLSGLESGVVYYDNRQRSLVLEESVSEAVRVIDDLVISLENCESVIGKNLLLISALNKDNDDEIQINTSFEREAIYCFEHSIHHQALIKVGLQELGVAKLCSAEFGMAPSTLKNRKAIKI